MANSGEAKVGAHDASVSGDPPSEAMVVCHAETGEPLVNPQTGDQIVQEHPSVEANQELDNAQRGLAKAEENLDAAKARVAAAKQSVKDAESRWGEIVADLTERYGATPEGQE